jgi:hypothetical protein
MPLEAITLWCVVNGYPNEISVGHGVSVFHLKEMIKKKMVLNDATAKITLWKVRIFYTPT